MNASTFLSLTAAGLFSLCAGSMVLSRQQASAATPAPVSHIVDLPAVTVRPDPADLAYLQALRAHVVDLPAVVVRPEPADLAATALAAVDRIVDLPAVVVHPDAGDLAAPVMVGIGAPLASDLISH
ncbi:MAG: hypothetical protein QM601_11775 [Pseudoxanthomonas sp.]